MIIIIETKLIRFNSLEFITYFVLGYLYNIEELINKKYISY